MKIFSEKNNKQWPKKIILGLLVFCFVFILAPNPKPARALMPVTDPANTSANVAATVWDKIWENLKMAWEKSGSAAFQSLVRNSLNRIAYDLAKEVATAGEGQKPLFVQEDFKDYVGNSMDAVAGEFIDTLNSWSGINLCEPTVNIKGVIGLGLVNQQRPAEPSCTFKKMTNAWVSEAERWKSMTEDKEYLNKISNAFSPTSSGLGITLSLMTGLDEQIQKEQTAKWNELGFKQGWLDERDIAGNLLGRPDATKNALDNSERLTYDSMLKTTGNALIDAANVFLNQLAIEGINRLSRELGRASKKPQEDVFGNLADSFSDYVDNSRGGATEETRRLAATVLEPRFDSRADYDVINDLAICPDPNNPGPSNCVIDEQFRDAISEQLTVIEAVEAGYLHGDWLLSKEVDYNQGYNYRSFIILRKYRIVPAVWEQAMLRIDEYNKKVTLMDMVSCFDQDDEYNDFSDSFGFDYSWCEGLIDPNWVLKAPQHYCKKEGYGPVVNQMIIDGIDTSGDGVADVKSQLKVVRVDDYCADEQSCIKERDDGTCEAFGYCTSEKRVWRFDSDSCEPEYNSCQSFVGEDGNQAAYLKNTLDYCTADDAGCKAYAISGDYDQVSDVVNWNDDSIAYLNSQAEECAAKDEGCHEFIRVKEGYGANLLVDGSLEEAEIAVGPTGHNIAGEAYTLSFYARGCWSSDQIILGVVNENNELIEYTEVPGLLAGDEWHYYSVTHEFSVDKNLGNKVYFRLYNPTQAGEDFKCRVVDSLKLEKGNYGTNYSSYRGDGLIYQKFIPVYLQDVCYINAGDNNTDYRLRDDAPAVCDDYARQCNAEELGCELYTASKDDFEIAAKTKAADYCHSECVGYDVYVQKNDYFSSSKGVSFIPDLTTSCNAEAVGCSEFTNLDNPNAGGEDREYYSYLRQCVLPGEANCESFYSWEGTEESGYQLRSLSLKAEDGEPVVLLDDSELCNQEIYNYPPSHPGYNSDCREFYNREGDVSYHLYTLTLTCSDDCHRYRLTNKNIDTTRTKASECSGLAYGWDAEKDVCYYCQNGGTWDLNQQACIYKAVPSQGNSCTAEQNGCHEYNGNSGNNMRIAANYDFESGVSGWVGFGGANLEQSTESNDRNGHSLHYSLGGGSGNSGGLGLIRQALAADKGMKVDATDFAVQGSAYVIKFLAKASKDVKVEVSFSDGTHESIFNISRNVNEPLVVTAGGEWNFYQISLDDLSHNPGDNEVLIISADGEFYIDDIIINQITDRYYLVENSWNIPNICYYDIYDQYQGADYNLGCENYVDRAGQDHALRQFSALCEDQSVGCEVLIDTHNYADNEAYVSDNDALVVPADNYIYGIVDFSQQCSSLDLGCQRLGLPYNQTNYNLASDVWVKNNPNRYDEILCDEEGVSCQAWGSSTGTMYFKNPGENVCEYRQSNQAGSSYWGWYKVKAKHCGGNPSAEACQSDSDCVDEKCITDTTDYECWTDGFKTIGYSGQVVRQPANWAGICDPVASGCTEYIDPVSEDAINLISESRPSSFVESSGPAGAANEVCTPDGCGQSFGFYWDVNGQDIKVKPSTLYVFSVEGGHARISCDPMYELQSDNSFSTSTPAIEIASNESALFITESDSCYVQLGDGEEGQIDYISLREAIIDYKLAQNIDKTSCNGSVSNDAGCILFNEREYKPSGLAPLNYSALETWYSPNQDRTPQSCDPSTEVCDANALIQVRPDRVCEQWLACQSYVEDDQGNKTCYDIGACDKLNPDNSCAHFSDLDETSEKNLANATGYFNVNNIYVSNMEEVGHMVSELQVDFESTNVDFTLVEGKGYIEVINDPDRARYYNITYPAQGAGFLRLSSDGIIVSKDMRVEAGKDYYLSLLANTSKLPRDTEARVDIVVKVDNVTDDESSTAYLLPINPDWQRLVYKFSSPFPGGANNNKITILVRFSSSSKSSTYSIFFDDINIEPVLEKNYDLDENNNHVNSEYIAKDCRLYPQQDSLSCSSRYNNIISDGWYGYCLQYDPANPQTCLQWYPVEHIERDSKGDVSSGVGKFPIYYCSQLDGKFDIVEKRKSFRAGFYKGIDDEALPCSNPINISDKEVVCDLWSASPSGYCGSNNYHVRAYRVKSGAKYDFYLFCEPKTRQRAYIPDSYLAPLIVRDDVIKITNIDSKNASSDTQDIPTFYTWGLYDGDFLLLVKSDFGAHADDANDGDAFAHSDFKLSSEKDDSGKYYYEYNEENNTFGTNFDPIMVFPLYDEWNGFGAAPESHMVKLDDYKISCNQITQVVKNDAYVTNKAWLQRVNGNSDYNIDELVYQGESDPPFGSMILSPNYDFQSEVYFKTLNNQKSDNLAGFPFGCNNGDIEEGGGHFIAYHIGEDPDNPTCGNIGVCGDSGTYCINIPGYENDQCPGNKNCVSLGIQSSDDYSAQELLKNIFLKSYGVYDWDVNQSAYAASVQYYDCLLGGNCEENIVYPCPNGVRSEGEFCAIQPEIDNISLFSPNSQRVNIENNTVSLSNSGIYTLQFDVAIDPEQAPVDRLEVNWGDGTKGMIPVDGGAVQYKVSHYYSVRGDSSEYKIIIKITDNWGLYYCTGNLRSSECFDF